ncbi:penicillin-binding protein activator LpoB [Myxococcota bacterium]|nr:penicillin-binding protein activator LpoB [Myxococcota bacterium]
MKLPVSVALACALTGCASTPPPPAGTDVKRTDEAIDLSGEWNDVDADTVAKAIIDECLSSPWIQTWRDANEQKRPVVRLYPIKNKTVGYIDHRYFTKQIEAAFVRSGLVDVVSSKEEAEDARAERDDQAQHASDDTAKAQGQETGSDFILNGWILTQDDRAGAKEVRAYLTSVEIIDTTTQKKACVAQKRIKKLLTKQP